MSFFSLLFLYSYNRTDLNNVKFHVVDLGAKEDMGRLVNLMESDYCENECMIRNNELFVQDVPITYRNTTWKHKRQNNISFTPITLMKSQLTLQ